MSPETAETVLEKPEPRLLDIQYLSGAIKVLSISYASELLFNQSRPVTFLHHLLLFSLFFLGQLAVHETYNQRIYPMLQWLLLQATTEQFTYIGMCFYHLSIFIKLQDYNRRKEVALVRISAALLRVSAILGFPLKLIPAGFACFWLGSMWSEVKKTLWGRFWLGWSTAVIATLLVLQCYFCDQAFPLAA
ncbi:hypothetical protein RQP46_000892 [Phenoliferia psychrophenolica]